MGKVLRVIFFFLLFLFFLHPLASDGDFWHHLATGKYVLEHLAVPLRDIWTHTASGRPWVPHSWGMGVLFYLAFNFFGGTGISLFVAFVALAVYILIYKFLKTYRMPDFPALFMIFLSLPAAAVRFPSRPEIAAYPLIITILLLDRLKKNRPRLVWFFPLIILLWANLYGASVILGMGILVVLGFKELFQKSEIRSTKPETNSNFQNPQQKSLENSNFGIVPNFGFQISNLYIFFFSPLFAFINPAGAKTVFYYFLITPVVAVQGEWAGIASIVREAPPDLMIAYQYFLGVYFLFLFSYLFILAVNHKKIRSYPFLFLLSLTVFVPFISFRQTAPAVFLSQPLMVLLLSNMGRTAKRTVFPVLTLFAVISFFFSLRVDPPKISAKTAAFPLGAVRFLKDNTIRGKLMSNQRLGAFLSYYLYPQNTVYQDTRDDLYLGTAVIGDYMNAFGVQDKIVPFLSKYGVDAVVGDYITGGLPYQPLFYSKDWSVVYLDDRFFIAVRRKTAQKKGLFEYKVEDPLSLSLVKPGREDEGLAEYRKIYEKNFRSLTNLTNYASVLFLTGDYSGVEKLLSGFKPQDYTDDYIMQVTSELKKDDLLWQAAFEQTKCPEVKLHLDRMDGLLRNLYPLLPGRVYPMDTDRGYAFYYLLCEKDREKARERLKLFLDKAYVSGYEKTRATVQFEKME